MDSLTEIEIRLGLLAISIEASRYDDLQNAPIHLPELFAGNESSERKPMTKKQLEEFIDHRWQKAMQSLEAQNKALQNRVADLEAGYSRLSQQIGS
jgi:hypothetical protein